MTTSTIGSTGNYSSIQLWLDACPASLTEDHIGECQNQEFALTIGYTVPTVTTNGYGIKLRCVTGASFRDHPDIATMPLVYDSTKGACIKLSASYENLHNGAGAIHLYDLMVHCTNNNTGTKFRGSIRYCIVEAAASSTRSILLGGTSSFARVCIIYSSGYALNGAADVFRGCTFYGYGSTTLPTIANSYGSASATNCAFLNNLPYKKGQGAATVTFTNCVTDSSAMDVLSTGGITETDCIYDINLDNEIANNTGSYQTADASIKGATAVSLINNGVDQSAYYTEDIRGNSILPGRYSVGATRHVPDSLYTLPSKFVEPNLLTPGKKPIGKVEINWNNPITKGLRVASITTPDGVRDLVNNIGLEQMGSNVTIRADAEEGLVTNSDGSEDSTGLAYYPYGTGFEGAQPYTIIGKFKKNTGLDVGYIFGQRGGDYLGTWMLKSANDGVGFKIYGSGWVINKNILGKNGTISDYTANIWHTLGVSGDSQSGTPINIYHDGINAENPLATNIAGFYNASNRVHLHGESRDNLIADSQTAFLYMFDRVLSEAEHKSLYNDPYQFLNPVTAPPLSIYFDSTTMRYELPNSLTTSELLPQGKKPIEKVEINLDNPLTRGIYRYYPLTEHQEIAYGSKYSVNGAPVNEPVGGQLARYFTNSSVAIERIMLGTGDFTVAFWIYIGRSVNAFEGFPIFAEDSTISDQNGIYLKCSGDQDGRLNPTQFAFRPDTSGSVADFINTDLTGMDEGWQHFVGVRKGNNLYGYQNGVDKSAGETVDSDEALTSNSADTIMFAGRQTNYTNAHHRDLVVWDRALSEDEVVSLYRNPYQLVTATTAPPLSIYFDNVPDGYYWIPDPRWEMPELLTPKKKPIGEVEIDWSNSITKDLYKYFPLAGDRELVNNFSIIYESDEIEFLDGYRCNHLIGGKDVQISTVSFSTEDFTFAFWMNMGRNLGDFESVELLGTTQTIPVANSFLLKGAAQSNGGGWNGARFQARPNETDFVSFAFGDLRDYGMGNNTGWHHVVLVRESDVAKCYINGQDASYNQSFTGSHTMSSMAKLGRIKTNYGNIRMRDVGFWKRAMRHAEATSLYLDPYQLLIPK